MNHKYLILCFLFFPIFVFSQHASNCYYLYPTPNEINEIIKKEDLVFNESLLNPENKVSNYTNDQSISLNLGIYLADMAYSAFFGQIHKFKSYLGVVKQLTNHLLISPETKEELISNFIKHSNDFDSIYQFTHDYYYKMINELEQNYSASAMSLIVAGAYIECLYIALNLTKYEEDSSLIQIVAKQKFAFNNLINCCKFKSRDKDITSILNDLLEIQDIYNNVSIQKVEILRVERTNDEKITLRGGPILKMKRKEFYKLKKTISRVRKKIVETNYSI